MVCICLGNFCHSVGTSLRQAPTKACGAIAQAGGVVKEEAQKLATHVSEVVTSIFACIGEHLRIFRDNLVETATSAGQGIRYGAGVVGENVKVGAVHIKDYLKNREHRQKVIIYLLAWAVIIVLLGVLASGILNGQGSHVAQGFSRVSLPLIIGFAPGTLVGVITSIVVRKILQTRSPEVQEKWKSRNTIWKILSGALDTQDEGTKRIAYGVVVPVLVAAAILQPYALGALFGFISANHVATIVPEWVEGEKKKMQTPSMDPSLLAVQHQPITGDDPKAEFELYGAY